MIIKIIITIGVINKYDNNIINDKKGKNIEEK